MTDAWLYEQMSYPLLMMEARRLRSELETLTARAEKLTASAELVTRELDKSWPRGKGRSRRKATRHDRRRGR